MLRPVPYGAVAKSTSTLSETASKTLLAGYGVPFAPERVVADPEAAVEAARAVGLPVALKLNGDRIAHKTERGLVRLNVASDDAVRAAAAELLSAARPDDGAVDLLVAPMLRGNRELIAGLTRDEHFGPTVMLGVGGVLAEAISDVVFRLAPITADDAYEMIDDLRSQSLLGPFRGEPALDRAKTAAVLLALSAVAADADVVSVDLNPLIVVDGQPIAVDALVERS
jgi:acetate---CoA ligase (ADP-forming) subunit beta